MNFLMPLWGGHYDIDHYQQFLDEIPADCQPEFILFGPNQWNFNDNTINLDRNKKRANMKRRIDPLNEFGKNIQAINRKIVKGDLAGKDIMQIFANTGKCYGMIANFKGDGYINDGSYYYNDTIKKGGVFKDPTVKDYRFKDTLKEIEKGQDHFSFGSHVSENALKQLDQFLTTCKKRNIQVIGYLPPLPDKVFGKIDAMKDKFAYIYELKDKVEPVFKKHGCEFYDYGRFDAFGATDQEAIDGYHVSEKAYLRLLINMRKKSPLLKKYTDEKYMDSLIRNSKSNLLVLEKE